MAAQGMFARVTLFQTPACQHPWGVECGFGFREVPALVQGLEDVITSFEPPELLHAGLNGVGVRNMATLKDIRLRLRSVTNIQKITKSMKMVSAAKFARAEKELKPAKVYGQGAAALLEKGEISSDTSKPNHLFFAISSDRGLCGGIHSGMAKAIKAKVAEQPSGVNTMVALCGDKVKGILQRTHSDSILMHMTETGRKPPVFSEAAFIAGELLDSGYEFDAGQILYNKFKSVLSFNVTAQDMPSLDTVAESENLSVYDDIDADVLRNYHEFTLASLIFYGMKESACSEQSSRMTAMDGASKNAAIANMDTIVPNAANFDCTIPTNVSTTTYMLYKDNVKVVTAIISVDNGTITDDSDEFAVFGGLQTIAFQLEVSKLDSQGLYKCVYLSNGTLVSGEEYQLTVFAAPLAMTNRTQSKIFVGEMLYVKCNATGNPKPVTQWMLPAASQATIFDSILIINASMNDNGIFQCLASNSYGRSSSNVSVTVMDQYPDKATLQLQDRDENSLTLKWSPPSYLGRGGVLKNYVLKCSVISLQRSFSSAETSYIVSSLQPFTAYKFILIACNYYVCGPEYIVQFETLERGKPAKPTNLNTTTITAHDVTIAWTHGQHSGQVLYTNVSFWKLTGDTSRTTLKSSTQSSQYKINGLSPYTEYGVEVVTCVQGQTKVLCSDPSASVNFKTDIAAPSPPIILSLYNTDTPEVAVVVMWHEPALLNGPTVSYEVQYKEQQDIDWVTNDVPKPKQSGISKRSIKDPLAYILANVRPVTKYDIRVSAGNSRGHTYSSVKIIATDEAVPSKPQNLTDKKITAHALTVSWLAPKRVLTPIECYFVIVKDVVKKSPKSLTSCKKNTLEITIDKLSENTTYSVSVRATVRRKRDNVTLEGPMIDKIFRTIIDKPIVAPGPGKQGADSLVWATVLSLVIVAAVISIALIYCKKKNVFEAKPTKSRFYVEELKPRTLASRLSARTFEPKHPPIDVEDFPEHVAQLHADSDYLFSEEYLHLGPPKPDFTWEHSTLHLNRPKNRYQDIVAYDHSRVRLMSIDGVPASNYINANFVDGFDKKPAYIATQAPLNQTIEDFWRMVWEQDARIIVMLTNLWERGRRKCDQYWPHQGELMYGSVTVRTVEERRYANYVHRVFSISWNNKEEAAELGYSTDEIKLVRQFHFTDWPDFGVPKERSSMLAYVHMVRRYMQETETPTVVHCSAGVGRSGTFIVIETQIERINRKKNVKIFDYIKNIRTQRNFLVQQEVQYVFIHDALVDYIKCGLTAIPVSELKETLEANYFTPQPDNGLSIIDEEWQIINEFNIQEFEMLTGRRPCNQQKNRDSFILPIDGCRVRLTVRGAADGTDYINANYIDGFYQKKKFIVTQMPLYDTIEDFWRMIWENFSEIIVSLLTDQEREKEDFFDYLPRPDCNPVNFGTFEIHCLSEETDEYVRIKQLELVGRQEWGESEKRKIYHYQYLHWPEDELPVVDHLFKIMDDIKERKRLMEASRTSPDSSPIVVHCSCGVGRSGVFCALNNIKEQMDDFEETVDVFTTARLLRSQRPLIIQNKAHYEYLYHSALRYKEMSSKYPATDGDSLPLANQQSPSDNTEENEGLIDNMEQDNDDWQL
eukprot:gene6241-6959_t